MKKTAREKDYPFIEEWTGLPLALAHARIVAMAETLLPVRVAE
jgi:hypothetical protein